MAVDAKRRSANPEQRPAGPGQNATPEASQDAGRPLSGYYAAGPALSLPERPSANGQTEQPEASTRTSTVTPTEQPVGQPTVPSSEASPSPAPQLAPTSTPSTAPAVPVTPDRPPGPAGEASVAPTPTPAPGGTTAPTSAAPASATPASPSPTGTEPTGPSATAQPVQPAEPGPTGEKTTPAPPRTPPGAEQGHTRSVEIAEPASAPTTELQGPGSASREQASGGSPVANAVAEKPVGEAGQLPKKLDEANPKAEAAAKAKSGARVSGEAGAATKAQREGGELAAATAAPPEPSAAAEGIDRDTALNDATEAVARLQDASAPLATVASGAVRFAPRQEELSSDPLVAAQGQQKRAAAEAFATDFLARNTARTQEIVAVGQLAPGRIGAAAEAAKAAIDASVAENRDALAASINAARIRARAAAASATIQIMAHHQAAIPLVKATTLIARTRVIAAHAVAVGQVDVLEKSQVDKIDTLYAEGDKIFRATGPKVGDEAVAYGRKRSGEYLDQRNGESSILDGPIHDNRLEAKADAAIKVGDEYKKGLVKEADKQADAGQKGKPKDLATVAESARKSRETLDTQLTAAQAALDGAESQTLAASEEATRSLQQGVQANLAATTLALDEQETAQLEALGQFGERQKATVDRDAARAIASLVDGTAEAVGGLTRTLESYRTSAQGTAAPDLPVLGSILNEAQGSVDALVANVSQGLGAGIEMSEQSIADGASQTSEGIAALGQSGVEQAGAVRDSFSASMAAVVGSATSTFAQFTQTHRDTVDRSATTATNGFTSISTGIETLFRTNATNLENGFKQAAKGLEDGLRASLTNHSESTDVTKYADEAAKQVQPRWKKILKVVLIIAVILVVALVVGPAVIGAVGAAAGALGAGAAAGAIGTVVGGAIVGAAAGATIQLGNNVIDGKPNLLEGVGKAALVGAIAGGLGGAGSLVASSVGSSLGAVSQVVLRGAINQVFGVGGQILGDLAVGNPITWQGVALGAGIGLAAGGVLGGLSKLGRIGAAIEGVQTRSLAAGTRFGGAVGGRVSLATGIGARAPTPAIETPPAAPGATTTEAAAATEVAAQPTTTTATTQPAPPSLAQAAPPATTAPPEVAPAPTPVRPAPAPAAPEVTAGPAPTPRPAQPPVAPAETPPAVAPSPAETPAAVSEVAPAPAPAAPAPIEARPAGSPTVETAPPTAAQPGKPTPAAPAHPEAVKPAVEEAGAPPTSTAKPAEAAVEPKPAEPTPAKAPPESEPPPATVEEAVAGETAATRIGKQVHKQRADVRRAAGDFDEVNGPITDKDGNAIQVPRRVDLETGEPQAGARLQDARPDAVNYKDGLILDDKPAGRPIAKDRQEIIRFIKAFQAREGVLPKTIEIHRYDPTTGAPAGVETYTPSDFLPKPKGTDGT